MLLIHHLISFTDHLPAVGFSHVFYHKQRTWCYTCLAPAMRTGNVAKPYHILFLSFFFLPG